MRDVCCRCTQPLWAVISRVFVQLITQQMLVVAVVLNTSNHSITEGAINHDTGTLKILYAA